MFQVLSSPLFNFPVKQQYSNQWFPEKTRLHFFIIYPEKMQGILPMPLL